MPFDAPTQAVMKRAYEEAVDQLSGQSVRLDETTRRAMARAILCMTRLGERDPETLMRYAAFKARTMLMGLDE
ncbi:hypothetical protein [Hyphomicrobium sp.]|uniref:hypothetical protein n=1 Tax=Hyphomicrobium sp. TaxID=82 RepID=UPI002B9F0B78|nr:hypothetical protein [Hyphomicrobium sp.]HVZ04049.1 hypothetical protein [Hyphomicrobium sp.]